MLSFFSVSCISSKVYTKTKCMECLNRNLGILLMPLSWDPGFRLLSVPQKNELEREILKILVAHSISKVDLLDNMDYELLNANIHDLNDSSQRSKVFTHLGYKYLLGVSLGETSDSDGWDYESYEDQNALYPVYREPLKVKALVRVALIEAESGKIASDHTIQTIIGEVPIPAEDGDTNYINFGSISKAVFIAVKKGVKFTIKDCECRLNSLTDSQDF